MVIYYVWVKKTYFLFPTDQEKTLIFIKFVSHIFRVQGIWDGAKHKTLWVEIVDSTVYSYKLKNGQTYWHSILRNIY